MKQTKFWHLLAVMMVAMLSMTMVSCGGDDDDDDFGTGGGSSSNPLVGTWVLSESGSYPDDYSSTETWSFSKNGTGSFSVSGYTTWKGQRDSYSAKGNFNYTVLAVDENTKSGYVRIVFNSVSGDEWYRQGETLDWSFAVGGDVLNLNGTSFRKR